MTFGPTSPAEKGGGGQRRDAGAVLEPRSIAVIGASRQRGSVGGEVFHNLLAGEFAGPVYPVNRAATVVQSVPAYPTVEAIPGPVDLAVIAVPAADVLSAAEACARKGVRAVVVLSAGFAESGEEGRRRQAELLRLCREDGMRLVGPNCIGVVNTDPAVRLNATFAPTQPTAGCLGFASQSGALGLAAIEYAATLGLGVSSFVSLGNKADISTNDLLDYWESDPRTEVILLYLESFGNPRRFSRIARRVARRKPIVAVKSGRSAAGARASSTHTGAMLAASDLTVEALFRQAGVIRTDTLDEMFGVASLLANQPLPAGRRVGIVSNVGGPAILAADACEARMLLVPVLAEETQARLRSLLPAEASVGNPVDMIATATAEQYGEAIRLVAEDANVDAVITIFIQPFVTRATDMARSILEAVRGLDGGKPVLAVFMSSMEGGQSLRSAGVSLPCYAFPESAAIVATVLERGGGWLEPQEVVDLLVCYGLSLPAQRLASGPEEAGAEALGGAVALKAMVPGLVHKSDAGAVRLGLQGAAAVRRAAREMAASLEAHGFSPRGFLVREMVPPGVEMIAGIVDDRLFGPVVACGAGGVLVELLGDVAVRLAPLTEPEAREMVRSLKSYPLLTGYRGAPGRDVAALEDVLLRLSALAEDLPQVAELDCNPIMALERGAVIADARVRVEPAEASVPARARS